VAVVKKKGIGYTIEFKFEACEYTEKSSNEKAAKIGLATQISHDYCVRFLLTDYA